MRVMVHVVFYLCLLAATLSAHVAPVKGAPSPLSLRYKVDETFVVVDDGSGDDGHSVEQSRRHVAAVHRFVRAAAAAVELAGGGGTQQQLPQPKSHVVVEQDANISQQHHQDVALVDDAAIRNERSTNLSHITGTARKIQMYITNRHLQILPDGTVNGTNDDASDYTILQRTTVGIGKLKIQGVATCQYLCMDSCGLLYGSREFSEECIFNEMMGQHHYNTYSSARYSNKNRTLYLALNRRGQSRKVMTRIRQVENKQSPLGKLSMYTRVLTKPVSAKRVDDLVAEMMKTFASNVNSTHQTGNETSPSTATAHPLRHHGMAGNHQHQLCPPVSPEHHEASNHARGKFRCRKRKKRKKKRRKLNDKVKHDNSDSKFPIQTNIKNKKVLNSECSEIERINCNNNNNKKQLSTRNNKNNKKDNNKSLGDCDLRKKRMCLKRTKDVANGSDGTTGITTGATTDTNFHEREVDAIESVDDENRCEKGTPCERFMPDAGEEDYDWLDADVTAASVQDGLDNSDGFALEEVSSSLPPPPVTDDAPTPEPVCTNFNECPEL